MKTIRVLLPLLLALLTPASSVATEPEKPALEFKRLDLLDKRILRDVVVRSYDARADKFLVIAGGKAMTITASLVPAPFAEQLRTTAPASGSTVSSRPDSPSRPRTDAPAPNSSIVPAPASTPTPDNSAAMSAAHRAAAIDRALTFYRYEFVAGSAAMRVDSVKIDAAATQAVSGWSGRYRTTGKAYLELFDTKGWSATRATSSFEIITEQKPNEPITVIDFSRKS